MAIDMRQFHQTFFEESLEGLAGMETELLRLEKTASDSGDENVQADPEILNTIFRGAHSIKGGSSTFGFNDVAAFAHVLESRLDALREGKILPNRHVIGLLLLAVDCLRNLILTAKTGQPFDKQAIDAVHAQLENLESEKSASTTVQKSSASKATSKTTSWHIVFQPHRRLFHTGNDPARVLRELAALGSLKVNANISELPAWEQMDAEECYLAWDVEFEGNVTRDMIQEVFEWVVNDSTIEITPLAVNANAQSSVNSEVMAPKETSVVDAYNGSIRVSIPKVDALINMVGELVITQSMLSQLAGQFSLESLPKLFIGLTQLERNTRELQESVMRIRMLPLSFAFNRFPRMIRDMSEKLGKQVDLYISGEQTELDKTVIERINDPLVHLVRNCLDHGIESPAERIAVGKPPTGRIELKAYQKGGNVVIEIRDDGHGLQHERIFAKAVERGLVSPEAKLSPEEIAEIIFLPGFSTAETVSDISGRGVGMDIVRNNIRMLGGNVEIASSSGVGICFTVRLPLTLAILDGLSVLIGNHTYILPLVSIVESVRVRPQLISRPAGGGELFSLRKEYLPFIRLHELFGIEPRSTDLNQGLLVVVEADGKKASLYVDDLLGQQQVVIKSLETHYRKVDGISAATILGDGTVAMILDVAGLIRMAHAGGVRFTVEDHRHLPVTANVNAASPNLN